MDTRITVITVEQGLALLKNRGISIETPDTEVSEPAFAALRSWLSGLTPDMPSSADFSAQGPEVLVYESGSHQTRITFLWGGWNPHAEVEDMTAGELAAEHGPELTAEVEAAVSGLPFSKYAAFVRPYLG